MKADTRCPSPEVHFLGEIVIAFGNLELALEASIWQLLRADSERYRMAQALTAVMSFKQKTQAFASMFREKRIASAESELQDLTGKLFAAEQERNQIIHSAWHGWKGQGLTRMKATTNNKKGLRRTIYRMPPKRIESTLTCISAAFQSLGHFSIKYIRPQRERGNQTPVTGGTAAE